VAVADNQRSWCWWSWWPVVMTYTILIVNREAEA